MIKNTLKAFAIHIFVCITAAIFFVPFHMSTPKWTSEQAARNHHYLMLALASVSFLICIAVYIYLARKFLRNQGGVIYNIISVSLITFVGILMWIIIIITGVDDKMLSTDELFFYSLYNGSALFGIWELEITSPISLLTLSIIPAAAMGLSIKHKALKNN